MDRHLDYTYAEAYNPVVLWFAWLKADDIVFDPCCGTAGFLIAAMHNMLKKADNDVQKKSIRQNQLHGIELRPNMFTIATTNMICVVMERAIL